MTPSAFKRSLAGSMPPARLSPALTALWWAGKDGWDQAHKIAMSDEGAACAWVHAYLHRVEGDLENARYWYHQAGRSPPSDSPTAEWARIADALIGSESR